MEICALASFIKHILSKPQLFGSLINPLSANLTKWSNILKQYVGNFRRIVWVCLTILWGWRLKVKLTQAILIN